MYIFYTSVKLSIIEENHARKELSISLQPPLLFLYGLVPLHLKHAKILKLSKIVTQTIKNNL